LAAGGVLVALVHSGPKNEVAGEVLALLDADLAAADLLLVVEDDAVALAERPPAILTGAIGRGATGE